MSEVSATKILLESGYALTCSTCAKMHRAMARGSVQCEAAEKEIDCAGPLAGSSFPAYEGPLTLAARATMCFMCGAPASHTLETRDGVFSGVCPRHLNSCIQTSSEALVPIDESHRRS